MPVIIGIAVAIWVLACAINSRVLPHEGPAADLFRWMRWITLLIVASPGFLLLALMPQETGPSTGALFSLPFLAPLAYAALRAWRQPRP